MAVRLGVTAGDGRIGSSLRVADVNGDGLDDIVTGVPNHESSTGAFPGEIVIFAGSPNGVSLLQQLMWSPQTGSSGLLEIPADGDDLAASLAIGDFNNDGKIDLVGGMPTRSDNGDGLDLIPESGAFFEFFGGSEFPQTAPPFTSGNGVYFDEGNS
jgi:hypothetical protein